MAKKEKPSKGFVDRTTMTGEGITMTPPSTIGTGKHYVGSDHKPTPEEALDMGRALFDAIAGERAKSARASTQENS